MQQSRKASSADIKSIKRPHTCASCENIVIREADLIEKPREVILFQGEEPTQKCLYYRYLSRFLNRRDDQRGLPIVARFDPKIPTSNTLRVTESDALRVYSLSEEDVSSKALPVARIHTDVQSERAFTQAKKWINECFSAHPFCADLRTGFIPTRLLEVGGKDDNRIRLVEMDNRPNIKWASLSYVWGGQQETRTTRTTLSKHLEGIEMDTLPQTLLDAIKVCRELNILYLWIDALCIIQDDERDLLRELASMPQIYQEAYITIQAARAQGVQAGFLGKTVYSYDTFPPTQIQYKSLDGRMGQVLLCQQDHSQILTGDPIESRAWTFQESMLSPRSLRFTRDLMRWSCRSAQKFDGNWKKQDRVFINDTYDWNCADVPCIPGRPMPAWEAMVDSYSERKMTKQSDRLVAISAIAKLYGDSNKHTYLAGLWNETLPLGLCWMVEQGSREPRPKEFRAPSWSWASINTPIRHVGMWWIKEGETKNGRTGLFIGQETVADGVDVVEANVEPTSVGTEYFSIKSASLTIKAPIRLVEWDVDYREGIGEISMDDVGCTGYADAWENDWPDKETLLDYLGRSEPDEAAENDDRSSVSSDAAYGSFQVFAMPISKVRHYDHGIIEQYADGTTLGKNAALTRCGILLRKDGQHYNRVGFFRWHVDEELYACQAASLPGFEVNTITII